jgi:trehalose 6-phosphate phosphatase
MYYEMIGFVPEQGDPPSSDVPPFSPAESALFLDFDGALVEIAETPDSIHVPEKLETLLNALVDASDGATALVSGRSVAALRKFLPGFKGVLIGGHGAETEQDGTRRQLVEADPECVEHLVELVEAFAKCDPGYLAEAKPTGVVLHFRKNPDLRGSAYHFLETILHDISGFHIHHSKMAFEIRPDGASKDAAVERLMQEPPFEGRRPVYIGDDVTDEPALAYCRTCEGMAIKVGEGNTEGNYRLDGVSDVLAYLSWSLSEPESA